ncbi:MAG: M23 family metallopeptidase [Treponema sp.]|nr:M23 family metallopeptidase [Treponema sp.]
MEIISYVQDKPREKRIHFSLFGSGRVKAEKSISLTYPVYLPEFRSFSAKKVRNTISFRSVLKSLGSALTLSGDFLKSNIKVISITLLLAVLAVSLSVGSLKLHSFSINHTGPLELEGESLDIQNLNKLMASFALEGSKEYDEAGNLLDMKGLESEVFTQPVTYQTYKVRSGDTISGIAIKFGLRNISTLISVNDIGNVRQLAAGQKLRIPSVDGIIYTVKKGDSLNGISTKYGISLDNLLDVNDLTKETLTAGQQLFIPGVGLDAGTLRNAMGELFTMPIAAKFRWSSPYGYRADPFTGVKTFHTGTDMACPTGTPILASMSGRVMKVGTMHRIYGNYVIIDHGNGYQTLYAHMSKVIAAKGQWVSQGTRIGLVGSTGYSTGPHLHFTVYKNGKLVDPMSVLK